MRAPGMSGSAQILSLLSPGLTAQSGHWLLPCTVSTFMKPVNENGPKSMAWAEVVAAHSAAAATGRQARAAARRGNAVFVARSGVAGAWWGWCMVLAAGRTG